MTERKPPGVPFETWVDRQMREAEARGAFDDLPGKGKPLPAADGPYDEMWWVKDMMRRENLSYLPPTLALRKEAEDTYTAAMGAPTETAVRRVLEAVNEKIRAMLAMPPPGPVLGIRPFDVDEAVAKWREERARRQGSG